jgi:hypothetical protein
MVCRCWPSVVAFGPTQFCPFDTQVVKEACWVISNAAKEATDEQVRVRDS